MPPTQALCPVRPSAASSFRAAPAGHPKASRRQSPIVTRKGPTRPSITKSVHTNTAECEQYIDAAQAYCACTRTVELDEHVHTVMAH